MEFKNKTTGLKNKLERMTELNDKLAIAQAWESLDSSLFDKGSIKCQLIGKSISQGGGGDRVIVTKGDGAVKEFAFESLPPVLKNHYEEVIASR